MKKKYCLHRTWYLILIAIGCMPCLAMNVKTPRGPHQKIEKVELSFRQQKERVAPVLTQKRIKARKRFGYKKNKPLPEPKITMSNMTYAEMKNRKNELLAIDTTKNTHSKRYLFKIKQHTANNKQIAARYLDRMVKMCDDPNERADLLVELGDIQFDLGELRKAEATLKEFIELYPGHKQIEYAYYKGLLCAFYHTLSADRDQTATYDAIRLADQFLDRMDLFIEYQDEVKKIRKECYAKLIQSEFNVCNYYLNRYNFKAVENRLDVVRNQFMQEVPEIEPQLIGYESKLATQRAEFIATQQKQAQSAVPITPQPIAEGEVVAQQATAINPESDDSNHASLTQQS